IPGSADPGHVSGTSTRGAQRPSFLVAGPPPSARKVALCTGRTGGPVCENVSGIGPTWSGQLHRQPAELDHAWTLVELRCRITSVAMGVLQAGLAALGRPPDGARTKNVSGIGPTWSGQLHRQPAEL